MKYLLLAVFALIIPFFNNFLFAETEFSIDTILTRNVTSLTYNSKNENVYVALDPDRIAIINSKTNKCQQPQQNSFICLSCCTA
jgi:hypothetical protein